MSGIVFRAMVVAPIAAWCGLALGVVTACGDSESSTASGGSSSATGGSSTSGGSSSSGGSSATGGGSVTGGSAGTTAAEPFPTGFGSPEVFVPSLTMPVRLGLKNGFLYFTEMGLPSTGTLSRLARRDPAGNVQTLYSGNTVAALFLDDDELFFVERGTRKVFRMKYTTLTPELFATAPATFNVGDLTRVGEEIWMTEFATGTPQTTTIVAQPRSGGTPRDVVPVSTLGFIFTYLQLAQGQVYVATQGTGTGLFAGSQSKAPTMIVPNVGSNRLSADANFVYFGSEDDGRVLRLAHGTSTPELVASGQSSPFAVNVDGGGIYWTNGPDCEPGGATTALGSVMARALSGGMPVTVATAEHCPQAMVTDADFVYWIRENPNEAAGDDVIMRAKKLR